MLESSFLLRSWLDHVKYTTLLLIPALMQECCFPISFDTNLLDQQRASDTCLKRIIKGTKAPTCISVEAFPENEVMYGLY